MSVPKLQVTKNYRLFTRSIDNRPIDAKKHRRLLRSMQKNGFLPCFPLACIRTDQGALVIQDGQHRALFAEMLGLVIYFVVLDKPFDIAEVNGTQEKWKTRNFAETYAAQDNEDYAEGLRFADQYRLPIGTAFALLAGTTSFSNIDQVYYAGDFKIKEPAWAETVGSLYSSCVHASARVASSRLIEAIMAVTRVPQFDAQRLLASIEKCREKLHPYSTRDAYLEMLEEIYNYGRKNIFSLKNEAIMAMRKRNAVVKSQQAKKSRSVPGPTAAADDQSQPPIAEGK